MVSITSEVPPCTQALGRPHCFWATSAPPSLLVSPPHQRCPAPVPSSLRILHVISQQTSLACQANVCKANQTQEEVKIELLQVSSRVQQCLQLQIPQLDSEVLSPLTQQQRPCAHLFLPVKEAFQSSPREFLLRFKSLQ